MNGFKPVHNTILEELNTQESFSPFLHEIIEVFGKAHIYYRSFKQMHIFNKFFQNPSKGNPAVYGAALQLMGDYTSTGSYALQIALVTKCAEDLLREYRKLNQTYKNLCQAFKWQYPIYQHIEWNQEAGHTYTFLSPALRLSYQIRIMGIVKQIFKTTNCAVEVLWQSFKISMCLRDAYLLFEEDPQARFEACTELVANWDDYYHQLKENKNLLFEKVKEKCALVDRLLKNFGCANNSDFLIKSLEEQLEQLVEQTEDLVEDLGNVAEETLDTVYAKGKITPLHIDLSEGQNFIPALPIGRFPPWAGQKVEIIVPSPKSLENLENILSQTPLPGWNAFKGLMLVIDQVSQFYQAQVKDRKIAFV